MDRLQSMRVFAKVVEQGSFARAGVQLDISNAVVTRHVADLEQHLGTRLLNRSTRKLSLTETGQQYLERVRQILNDIDDADAMAAQSARCPSGTLRIYCHPNFGQVALAKLLPAFSALEPKVVLDVTLADRPVDLVEEGYDIGIFIDNQKIDSSMIARKLATSSVVLTAAPGYVSRKGEPMAPRDLSKHDCLNHSYEKVRHTWPVQCGGKPVEVPIVSRMVSNNNAVLREAAIAGLGVMMRPSFTLGDDIADGKLVRLLRDHCVGRLGVYMVYPSRRLLSAKVRAFTEFMAKSFPEPDADPWLKSL